MAGRHPSVEVGGLPCRACVPDYLLPWQAELVDELEREFESGEASVEERVVNASLRVLPAAVRVGAEQLFTLLAIFAEDAVVPSAAIDVVAPLMWRQGDEGQEGGAGQGGSFKRQTRRLLQQLLKSNLVRGSIEGGVFVHDLVRDCMCRRAEAAREGGLRATQREAVPLLLEASADASAQNVSGGGKSTSTVATDGYQLPSRRGSSASGIAVRGFLARGGPSSSPRPDAARKTVAFGPREGPGDRV